VTQTLESAGRFEAVCEPSPVTGPADDFEAFVRAHATDLLRSAVLLTGSRERGEDLLHDTLAHLYPRWSRVTAADAPVAYVRRAVVNRFISSRRSPSSRDVVVWDVPDAPAPRDLVDAVTDRHLLGQLIGALPDRQRAALMLRYFHDLPDEQIAEHLACRAATVRSLISRGLASLRRSVPTDAERKAERP